MFHLVDYENAVTFIYLHLQMQTRNTFVIYKHNISI